MLWLCEALGFSGSGFHTWLSHLHRQRSRQDTEIAASTSASLLARDRTYGVRRVWRRGKPNTVRHHSDRGSP